MASTEDRPSILTAQLPIKSDRMHCSSPLSDHGRQMAYLFLSSSIILEAGFGVDIGDIKGFVSGVNMGDAMGGEVAGSVELKEKL
jgi:hypothetical protein